LEEYTISVRENFDHISCKGVWVFWWKGIDQDYISYVLCHKNSSYLELFIFYEINFLSLYDVSMEC
jgi:hypothetical protein